MTSFMYSPLAKKLFIQGKPYSIKYTEIWDPTGGVGV